MIEACINSIIELMRGAVEITLPLLALGERSHRRPRAKPVFLRARIK